VGRESRKVSGPRAKPEGPTEFNDDQYAGAYPPGIEDTYWHLARCRILEKQVQAGGGKRVLDVGCGRGIVVDSLVSRGIDCYGVELAPVAVPERLRSRVTTGTGFADLPSALRLSIDTVILGDVIEHLADPVQFLQLLQQSLPQLRTMIVTVPARSELWSNYDVHYGHYRRYDLDMLRGNLEEAGLHLQELRYMFRLLYLPGRLLVASGKKRSVNPQPAGRLGLLHKLAAKLILAEYHLLPSGVYGMSAICRAVVK
jgi:SAM-dependent methyltransferase